MEKVTASTPSELSARVLAELKAELARLTSYTAELGEARASALSSQLAATEVLRLVDQLGDLQRTQIIDLKIGSDSTLEAHRKVLADMTDAWGQRWLEEATKSLTVLDTIVGRQHQLAVELTDFQEAMRSAGTFAEAQQSVRAQVMQMEDAVRQSSATVELEGDKLRSTVRQSTMQQGAAFSVLTSSVREQEQKVEMAVALLTSSSADLEAKVREHGARNTEQVNRLEQLISELRVTQTAAEKASAQQYTELLTAQSAAHDEIRHALLSGQTGSQRWNALTVLVVFGVLLAFQLFHFF